MQQVQRKLRLPPLQVSSSPIGILWREWLERAAWKKSSNMLDSLDLDPVYCRRDRRTDAIYRYQGPPASEHGSAIVDSFCPVAQKVYPGLPWHTFIYPFPLCPCPSHPVR